MSSYQSKRSTMMTHNENQYDAVNGSETDSTLHTRKTSHMRSESPFTGVVGYEDSTSNLRIDTIPPFAAAADSSEKSHLTSSSLSSSGSYNSHDNDPIGTAMGDSDDGSSSLSFCAAPRRYKLQWLSFFALGTLNNFSYVVINSAAKSLAESFDQGNLIGAVVWCNVGFGIGIKAINTFYLLHTSYVKRILAAAAICIAGCLIVAFGTWVNFWFCLLGVILVGCFSSLGESVMLGFMKHFDPKLMAAWGAGTGMAGVGGTSSYLLMFSVLKLSNRTIFFIQAPLVLIYWIAFKYLNRGVVDPSTINESDINVSLQPQRHHGLTSNKSHGDADSATLNLLAHDHSPVLNDPRDLVDDELSINVRQVNSTVTVGTDSLVPSPSDSTPSDVDAESLADQEYYASETSLQRTLRVARIIASPASQLAAVYFLEYVVSVGFASKANLHPDPDDWWKVNAYELLAFCYQIGVLIARSSVSIIQIRAIHWLTILQAAQFALWFVQATHPFLPLWFQFVDMIFVGLLGGAMYVNVFFILVSDGYLRRADRELGINLTSIGINFGIVFSAVFEIILFATMLKDE